MALGGIVLVTVVSIAGSAVRQGGAAGERELEQLEQRLVTAIGSGDLATYDRIVANDYVVVSANGTERTKQEVMAGYRARKEGYRDLRIGEVRAHVFGDTGVVSARTFGFRVDSSGAETPNRVRYVRVFARRDGRWQAVAQMAAPLPPEQK
jgi:ketosteroid isomerase-like protein